MSPVIGICPIIMRFLINGNVVSSRSTVLLRSMVYSGDSVQDTKKRISHQYRHREIELGMNLRAKNSQNECPPRQVTIHSTRSIHPNDLRRPRIARPTRTMSLWARKNSDSDKGSGEKKVENYEQEPQHLGAAGGSTAEL
jgi:hypothetical protein